MKSTSLFLFLLFSFSSAMAQEIVSKKSSSSVAGDYTTVARNKTWPVRLQTDRNIEQESKTIGSFKPTASEDEKDYYEFALPSGVTIAKLCFAGGNNAQKMELFTSKDNSRRTVLLPKKEKTIFADASIDKNQFTLERIARWLVDNQYL